MLLTAIRHIVFETCIDIAFDKISGNFFTEGCDGRELLIQEYYSVWVGYCNALGIPASNMTDFLDTIEGVSMFMMRREMNLLSAATEIYRESYG